MKKIIQFLLIPFVACMCLLLVGCEDPRITCEHKFEDEQQGNGNVNSGNNSGTNTGTSNPGNNTGSTVPTPETKHTFGEWVYSTNEDGETVLTRVCEGCGASEIKIEHAYANEWSYSDTKHYHACNGANCNEIANEADHIFNAWAGVNEGGKIFEKRSCTVCGYAQTREHKFGTQLTYSNTQHYYKCETCGTIKEVAQHTFGAWEVECLPEFNFIADSRTCTGCGYVQIKPHEYSTSWSFNETHHYHECKCETPCEIVNSFAEHTYSEWQNVTENGVDIEKRSCTVCKYTQTRQHNIETVWSVDATHHYHKCTNDSCTYVINKAEHTFGSWYITTTASAEYQEEKFRVCSGCNYREEFVGECAVTEGLVLELKADGTYIVKGYTGTKTIVSIPRIYKNKEVTEIQAKAFENCKDIERIYIPSSIKTIGEDAFIGCNIGAVNIYDLNAWLSIDFKTEESNPITGNLLVNGAFVKDISIGSVEVIKNYALANCKSLTKVRISGVVKEIGVGAFKNCTNLQAVFMYDGVLTIKQNAFENCTSMVSTKISSTITEIGDNAFSCCTSLSVIYIDSQTMLNKYCNKLSLGKLLYYAEYVYIEQGLTPPEILKNNIIYVNATSELYREGYSIYSLKVS